MDAHPPFDAAVPDRSVVDLADPELSIPARAAAVWITRAETGGALHGVWIESGVEWSECVDGDVIAVLGSCSGHGARLDGVHASLHLVHDRSVMPLGSWCDLAISEFADTIRPPAPRRWPCTASWMKPG